MFELNKNCSYISHVLHKAGLPTISLIFVIIVFYIIVVENMAGGHRYWYKWQYYIMLGIIRFHLSTNISTNIVAAFRGMHVSPAKHSYAWLPRKCDYRTDSHTQTDARQSDPYVPLCFAGDTIKGTEWQIHGNYTKQHFTPFHVDPWCDRITSDFYYAAESNDRGHIVFVLSVCLLSNLTFLAPCINVLFWGPGDFPVSSQNRDTSWIAWNRHSGSFMVDAGILFNNIKSPSH